jgi:hypothetical protein
VTGNSGSGGPGRFTAESFAHAQQILRQRPPTAAEIARETELEDLERLVAKYPSETETFLAQHKRGTQP